MLIRPVVTEKAVREAKLGRFTFEVGLGDDKTKIKNEVEKAFGVKVTKVQTLIVPGKEYRKGKGFRRGVRNDWKKTIVSLKEGQTIDLWD